MICVQTPEIQCSWFSIVLKPFSATLSLPFMLVVVIARQRMRVRFCTRKVPGRWSLHSFCFDDCSHFQKKGRYTGFTNDNKAKTKTITFGIKHGPCQTRPFFLFLSFSSPFPILSVPFLYSAFSFSLSSLMWILWSRCEASAWKNDRMQKAITCEKIIWKGSGFLHDPIWCENGIPPNPSVNHGELCVSMTIHDYPMHHWRHQFQTKPWALSLVIGPWGWQSCCNLQLCQHSVWLPCGKINPGFHRLSAGGSLATANLGPDMVNVGQCTDQIRSDKIR